MTEDRWNELMANTELALTQDELDDGYHFCSSFDELLIHVLDEEYKVCDCGYKEHYLGEHK